MTPRRKRARKAIAMREIAAAALSQLLPQDERDALRAAKVPAKSIIALFTPDHVILFSLGGPDRWFNITMTRRGAALKAKDARDTTIAAKTKRLASEHEEFRRRILAKPCGQKRKKTGSIPSRPFPKKQKVSHEPR